MKSGPKIDFVTPLSMRIPAMNTSTAPSIMNASSAPKSQKPVSKKAAPSTPAPVVSAPVVVAPKQEKASKKAAPASSVAPAVSATVVAPAPAPVVSATVEASPVEADGSVSSVQDDVKTMLAHANTLRETAAALVAELKRVDKRVAKLQKEADKRRRRVKKPVEGEEAKPRKPSIFELPTPLSNELCSFLGRASGSKDSRSNITKAVTTYVKEHNLKEKHTIKPDAKLKSLLGVAEGDVLTYFNLQRYLNRHYLKAAAPTA